MSETEKIKMFQYIVADYMGMVIYCLKDKKESQELDTSPSMGWGVQFSPEGSGLSYRPLTMKKEIFNHELLAKSIF